MTMTEIRAGLRDQDDGRHWSAGRCWCNAVHAVSTPVSLVLVPPPWDPARTRGAAA